MLILEPFYDQPPWGGKKLLSFCGNHPPIKIGHLYSVFAHSGRSNKILNGPNCGRPLGEVFSTFRDEVRLSQFECFPLTIALVDASEDLSIQVHPDDDMALQLEGSVQGKRESWYFIDAPTCGYIYNGCLAADKAQMNHHLQKNRLFEVMDRLSIAVGDYVYVQPGTIHAITAGSLVYEIEQGGDYTYRLYDYDRTDTEGNKRPLHTEKALPCLHTQRKSRAVPLPANTEIQEETYSICKVHFPIHYKNQSQTIECVTLLKGRGVLDGLSITPGMSLLLFPGEEMTCPEFEECFIAKMRNIV